MSDDWVIAKYKEAFYASELQNEGFDKLRTELDNSRAENSMLKLNYPLSITNEAIHMNEQNQKIRDQLIETQEANIQLKRKVRQLIEDDLRNNEDFRLNMAAQKVKVELNQRPPDLHIDLNVPLTPIFPLNNRLTTALETPTVMIPQATPAYKHYKRAPIPSFHGKKENVGDWLFLLETHFNADGLNDSQKVNMAAGYLRDLPLAMYRRISSGASVITWEGLKRQLLAEFQPFDLQCN